MVLVMFGKLVHDRWWRVLPLFVFPHPTKADAAPTADLLGLVKGDFKDPSGTTTSSHMISNSYWQNGQLETVSWLFHVCFFFGDYVLNLNNISHDIIKIIQAQPFGIVRTYPYASFSRSCRSIAIGTMVTLAVSCRWCPMPPEWWVSTRPKCASSNPSFSSSFWATAGQFGGQVTDKVCSNQITGALGEFSAVGDWTTSTTHLSWPKPLKGLKKLSIPLWTHVIPSSIWEPFCGFDQ